jgi:hypothetical protein
MTIVEQMLQAGYRFHTNHGKGLGCKGLYQRKIKDEEGTRYFINCFVWNFAEAFPHASAPEGDKYSFEVQFYDREGETFDVKTHDNFEANQYGRKIKTLREVEDFFTVIWEAACCGYYDEIF